MKACAVYTAIAGDYDDLRPHPDIDGVDWIAFVDRGVEGEERNGWQIRNTGSSKHPSAAVVRDGWWFADAHPRMRAKWFKIQSTTELAEYQRTLWVDGSVEWTDRGHEFIDSALRSVNWHPLMAFNHPDRMCIYDEAIVALKMPKYQDQPILRQIAQYWDDGHPFDWGLWACTIIARRNTPQVAEFEKRLWNEIQTWSYHDQLSLPKVCRDMEFVPGSMPGNVHDNPWFTLYQKPFAS